jgi:beta-lactamase superfamily II metal-dependent hydrolase
MINNDELKLHFLDVGHGDATIIEFPDHGSPNKIAHFAVVDFGAETRKNRELTSEYMKELVEMRKGGDQSLDYSIDFICVTHPHDDHYGGVNKFFNEFADRIRNFWDCGFRTNSLKYNAVLDLIYKNKNITFSRIAAGSEFEFGETRVTVLGPSVDLRNRFDTYGINKNNSSIVLKLKFKNSYAILAGDAQFASWGKIIEEFPRQSRITFFNDALGLSQRGETSDQLKCNVLRMSHHGSKHGTSLEYLERMDPKYVIISAGDLNYYNTESRRYKASDFPHSLVKEILKHLGDNINIFVTGEKGNIIFKYNGGWDAKPVTFLKQIPGTPQFRNDLKSLWP